MTVVFPDLEGAGTSAAFQSRDCWLTGEAGEQDSPYGGAAVRRRVNGRPGCGQQAGRARPTTPHQLENLQAFRCFFGGLALLLGGGGGTGPQCALRGEGGGMFRVHAVPRHGGPARVQAVQ